MENRNNNKKRRTTGKVFTESYNPNRIERLKSIIRDFHNQGKKKRYSILVDGEMIVSMNSDSRNFDNYKRYLEGHTQSIEVRMYFGESHNCNRHIFQTSQASLAGVNQQDVQEQIKEALEKQRIETELTTLRKDLERKNKKIEEYEEIIEELEAENDEKKINIQELLEKGFAMYSQYNANKNGGAVGAVGATPVQGVPEAEVNVEVEPESQTKCDKHYSQMKEHYSEKELEKGLKVWRIFTKHPELQNEFTQLINHKNQKDGEA